MARNKVLIVDDEVDITETLAYILQTKGFKPITATDGLDCIKKVSSENPDIILLDIKMPVMDGYDVCDSVRKNIKTKSIPIIIVTSSGDTDSIVKAHKVGASDYIVKPFNIPTLLQKMRKYI